MITDIPSVGHMGRIFLLTAIAVNTTILVIIWSALLSAQGIAAYILLFCAVPALMSSGMSFAITLCFACFPAQRTKTLEIAALILGVALLFWGMSSAAATTRIYSSIAIKPDRPKIDQCIAKLPETKDVKQGILQGLHAEFTARDIEMRCGLK